MVGVPPCRLEQNDGDRLSAAEHRGVSRLWRGRTPRGGSVGLVSTHDPLKEIRLPHKGNGVVHRTG